MPDRPEYATDEGSPDDPGALFERARRSAETGDVAEAARLLRKAAVGGHPSAQISAAKSIIDRKATATEIAEARAFLEAAAGRAFPAAASQLAVLDAIGYGGPADRARSFARLERLARAGWPPALLDFGIIAGGGAGSALIGAAASAGDPRAAMIAREIGPPPVACDHAAFETARRAFMSGPSPAPPAEVVAKEPVVQWRRRLLTRADRLYLRLIAEPLMTPSAVVDPAVGGARQESYRTSDGCVIGLSSMTLGVLTLYEKIAAAAGAPVDTCELIGVLRYRPGDEYRPHHDYLQEDAADYSQVRRAGQRIKTALILLNDEFNGGATTFPKRGLRLRGGPGDALVFENARADGAPIEESLHAGEPVTAGEKWMLTVWVRARRFWPWP